MPSGPSDWQAPTAGALGTESATGRGKKRKREGGGGGGGSLAPKPDLVSNAPSKYAVPPVYDDAPLAEGFNLAGRPDELHRSELGVRKSMVKTTGLFRRGSLNNESYFHFIVKTNKNEWIRFRREAVSVQIYGQIRNADRKAEGTPEERAEWHALLARQGKPLMWMDPDVMGTGFFQRVEVSINGLPVPTNGAVGNLLLQSVRANRVYGKQSPPENHLCRKSTSSVQREGQEPSEIKVLRLATAPFDYNRALSNTGVLVPVYLDGVFPFDFKCKILESVDNVKEPNLYFPPDTEIEIKMHLHRTKMEAIFHPELDLDKYFDGTKNVDDPPQMQFTFQDAHLEYESVLLLPNQEIGIMERFRRGERGYYDYDVVRGQHQALTPGASFTENYFQVMPWCRLFIIMFLPDWATFPMETRKRPLSGLTRFPANASKIVLSMAGEEALITEKFERFGMAGEQHQISKKIYYEYLRQNRLTTAEFEDWFPKDRDDESYIQAFLFDSRAHMSDKNEQLAVRCEFAAGHESPNHLQVACISIHPNGRAIVSAGSTNYSWVWEFKQNV